FMDHMMPEIDGVEATHMIRNEVAGYENVPIIALTANAVSGTKEMFLAEGMNDFIPKPSDMKDMAIKLKKWLSAEKLIFSEKSIKNEASQTSSIVIPELNVEKAIALLGNERLFMTVLKEYYFSIPKKADLIRKYWKDENWRNYTIELHALKSISKQIGADLVSSLAAELEAAGNNGDIELINKNTDRLLDEYCKYTTILSHLFDISEGPVHSDELTDDDILLKLDELVGALENFDILQIDDVIEDMDKYKYNEDYKAMFDELKEATESSDIQKCSEIILEWKNEILKSK
ncbi:MAG: response regulator, partial [Clostridia bacterium]|nr:response regulator [Clostridia bacterium]